MALQAHHSIQDLPKFVTKSYGDKIKTITTIAIKAGMLICFSSSTILAANAKEPSTQQTANKSIAEIITKASLLIDLGRHKEALKLIELQAKPTNYELNYLKARASLGANDRKTAEQQFAALVQVNQNDPRIYLSLGNIAGKNGDLNRAISFYRKAISIDSQYAKAYLNLGVALGAMGKPKEAKNEFSKAIEINPRMADAYRNRGIIHESIGDIKGACEDWLAAASLGQDEPRLWRQRKCNAEEFNKSNMTRKSRSTRTSNTE